MKTNIFLTGATGYIGGSLLTALLRHSNASNFNIIALMRGDPKRIEKLSTLKVTPLLGSNESFQILENAASESDVVIHTACSSDDLPSTQALISGLNKRTKTIGKSAIYIHTSGTCVISEDIRGQKGSNKIYTDLNTNEINNLSEEMPFRNVDLFIVQAAENNPLLKSVILIPPLVYGVGTGLFNRFSVQLPCLLKAALKRQKVEMIGPGQSIWNSVHIADLCDAYMLIFDQLLAVYGPNAQLNIQSNPYLSTGRDGYYFVENGTYTWRELAEKISEVLYKKNMIKTPEVTSFPDDEVEENLFDQYSWLLFGSQANCKADRLRKLGWNPHHPSLLESVEEETNILINNYKSE